MFPIRDDNPHFLTPVVTYGLIAANVLAWLCCKEPVPNRRCRARCVGSA